jgi:putative DNA primase/helicase
MRQVLRRLDVHKRDVQQIDGGSTWVAHCPDHTGRSGMVRFDQYNDGTVAVHPHRRAGQIVCEPESIIAALAITDERVRPYSTNGVGKVGDPFSKPARVRRNGGPTVDSHEIFERLKQALVDNDCTGPRGHPRYRCPACQAPGDGHGLRIAHHPNAAGTKRKILLICDANRCPAEEILEPLGMTLAELCAGDDVDDLDDESPDPMDKPQSSSGDNGEKPRPGPADSEADLANARRLVGMFGDRLRYVVPWKTWLCWDGTRWAIDDTGRANRYAKTIADMLPKIVKGGWPSRTQTAAGINAMLTLASTEEGIALAPADLDADPYLLNVGNGTLDLRTGQLRPHDPNDLLTKICGARYNPDAAAPEFETFLHRVQPDPAMRDFLARLFGHALLGKVVEHVLAILYGVGANGKTTLVEAVTGTFGDYARPIDPGLLIDRGDVHPTGVAALFGLRLAITHETDAGRRLAEGTVKRLTGGDKITARRMRENFWDFDPSHSIVMHTNHKPIVRGTDEGIWRRLRFVPFGVVIPEDEGDGKLPERLQLEADGILAWVVDGYRQWQDRGLAEPEQVTTATTAFRGESDMLGLFLEEKCRLDAGPFATVQSSHLFAEWVTWCKRENVEPGTQTAFSRDMTDRGHDKKKDGLGRMVWAGIDLYRTEDDK